MQTANFAFYQILKLRHCELWQVKDHHHHLKHRGDLQVLYSKSLGLFLLKFDDFKVALDKSYDVIGVSHQQQPYHAYLFPYPDGFFMIKVIDSEPGPALLNFETILQNTCNFVRKTNLDEELNRIFEDLPESTKGLSKESFKESLLKATESLHKLLSPSDNDTHPNQSICRSFDDITDLDALNIPAVDIPRDEVYKLKDQVKEIMGIHITNPRWIEFASKGVETAVNQGESGYVRVTTENIAVTMLGERKIPEQKDLLRQDVGKENVVESHVL
jgi:hypothetical protein